MFFEDFWTVLQNLHCRTFLVDVSMDLMIKTGQKDAFKSWVWTYEYFLFDCLLWWLLLFWFGYSAWFWGQNWRLWLIHHNSMFMSCKLFKNSLFIKKYPIIFPRKHSVNQLQKYLICQVSATSGLFTWFLSKISKHYFWGQHCICLFGCENFAVILVMLYVLPFPFSLAPDPLVYILKCHVKSMQYISNK